MRTSCVLLEVSEPIEFLPSFVTRMKSEERQVEVSLLLAAASGEGWEGLCWNF